MLAIQQKLNKTFYVLLSLPATAMGFALSVQISALSWLLVTKFGLDIHEMGFVWAAGPIAGMIAQPLVGLISDKVWFWGGRRRPFIIIGGTIAALMLLALPNISVINDSIGMGSLIAVAMIVALTLDLSINVSFNPTRSIIADVTSEGDERTKGYTWMQTISGSFGVLAYAIGAVFGNYFLIVFGAVLVFLLTIFPVFFIKEPKELTPSEKPDVSDETKVRKSDTNYPEFLKICLANSFSWIGVQTMFVFIIAFISQNINIIPDTASPEMIELLNNKTGQIIAISFLVLNAVGAILPKFVLQPIAEKIGRNKTQAAVVTIMSLGYFTIAFFVHSEVMLYLLMGVVGIGWAGIVSLPFASMSETVDQSRMGFYMGMFNLSVVIPQLIVSAFIGLVIVNSVDKNIVFIISGVSLAISAMLWALVKDNLSTSSE